VAIAAVAREGGVAGQFLLGLAGEGQIEGEAHVGGSHEYEGRFEGERQTVGGDLVVKVIRRVELGDAAAAPRRPPWPLPATA
jgi:hypothetical protein